MIFDKLDLPKDTGASDLQDSSRLAGIMKLFKWPQYIRINLYVIYKGKYVRHPSEYKYTFSRDQSICLFAGLYTAGYFYLVDPDYKTEGDLVSPSVRGHFRRCAGLQATWFQDLWLKLDIIYHAIGTPFNEPNQLICMLMIHPDKSYLKMWCKMNKQWKESITEYWCGWRGEPELANLMISSIEGLIK
jgi:hypothetical protein